MDQQPVPSWLAASWQRLWVINNNQGPPKDTVNVRNIQTPTLFGDCRIPKDRPAFPDAKSLADLTDAQLKTLYAQEGFSGYTTVDGYIITWHHEIGYQPPDGTIDIGRFEILGGRNVLEHGVQAVYLEHWWRLEQSGSDFLGVKVMRKLGDGRQRVHEILSVSGDHFIYARNRDFDLPMANSLADLIKQEKYTRKQILAVLDCEVSHGFVLGGRCPWQVQFSTLPFKENKPLDFAAQIVVDPKTGALSHRCSTPDLSWSFPVNTLDIEDLLVLFPPA
ncbi:hypothetical protein ELE36_19290 [Pseudolysobacter antarcticus]|uniref:Uncharacterized protein n=1 Tax=Pseudolysobacter antarcticus TaxID=2511995 RepID=A0A411HPB1_9GAMM|nr:hypothetical protein [Pseudolysobacter antarcticus]QBB72339.1 hypothetical protein ELE36_19290 [Pseudolysobacter antarcticus]